MPIFASSNSSMLSAEIASYTELVGPRLDKMSKKIAEKQGKKKKTNIKKKSDNFNTDNEQELTTRLNNLTKESQTVGRSNLENKNDERLRAGKNTKSYSISNHHMNFIPKWEEYEKVNINEGSMEDNYDEDESKRISKLDQALMSQGLNAISPSQLIQLLFSIFKNRYPHALNGIVKNQNYWHYQIAYILSTKHDAIVQEFLLSCSSNRTIKDCIEAIKKRYDNIREEERDSIDNNFCKYILRQM